MKKEQKFKRGNLVQVLVGHQICSNKEGVRCFQGCGGKCTVPQVWLVRS